jgi:glycosyltransferase involved in cell wall biosynthesis
LQKIVAGIQKNADFGESRLAGAAPTGAVDHPKPSPIELSVVAPCYNEEDGLAEFYHRTTAAIKAAGVTSYELLLVDDGSSDVTWTTIKYLADFDANVVGIRLSKNYGHQLALTAGLSRCRGEQVFILDADLQDPPELLADMRSLKQREGAEVVYGRRVEREGETRFKRLSAAAFYRVLNRLTDAPIPVDTGDFRLMSGRLARMIAKLPERDRFMRGLVSWSGFKQIPLEYKRERRFAGVSKYPIKKMLSFASDAILGFSMLPLRLAGVVSAVFFVAVLCLLGYVGISWLVLKPIPGWTSLAVIVLATSATQMFTLAVIGEYIGRIYMEGKRRPLFMIDEITGGEEVVDDEIRHG